MRLEELTITFDNDTDNESVTDNNDEKRGAIGTKNKS
jgi:hypothetical protein